jgi:ABC-type siderophore export system fused ATPase/permease subunit
LQIHLELAGATAGAAGAGSLSLFKPSVQVMQEASVIPLAVRQVPCLVVVISSQVLSAAFTAQLGSHLVHLVLSSIQDKHLAGQGSLQDVSELSAAFVKPPSSHLSTEVSDTNLYPFLAFVH